MKNSNNCFVRTEGRVVAIAGASNLCVVETKDAVLIADRNDVQNVKALSILCALKKNDVVTSMLLATDHGAPTSG